MILEFLFEIIIDGSLDLGGAVAPVAITNLSITYEKEFAAGFTGTTDLTIASTPVSSFGGADIFYWADADTLTKVTEFEAGKKYRLVLQKVYAESGYEFEADTDGNYTGTVTINGEADPEPIAYKIIYGANATWTQEPEQNSSAIISPKTGDESMNGYLFAIVLAISGMGALGAYEMKKRRNKQ